MRKIKLFLALMAVSQIILAQKTIDIPVSESSGLITFEEVIDVANKTKDEIYTLGEEWIVDHFMSANSVIQMRDKENGILIGKGQHGEVLIKVLGYPVMRNINFTIKIYCKDNRAKLVFTDISFESFDDGQLSRQSGEEMMFSKKSINKKGKPNKINIQYRENTIRIKTKIFNSIKQALNRTTIEKQEW